MYWWSNYLLTDFHTDELPTWSSYPNWWSRHPHNYWNTCWSSYLLLIPVLIKKLSLADNHIDEPPTWSSNSNGWSSHPHNYQYMYWSSYLLVLITISMKYLLSADNHIDVIAFNCWYPYWVSYVNIYIDKVPS